MGFCVWEVGASGPLVGVDHWLKDSKKEFRLKS